jgi:TetR/AcrR family transcriptional regulator, tetracycline repressor protein
MSGATRTPLSRERILVAAISYVDEHDLASLTMRRLGQLLGVEAMSLYHYVNGREDLLEGMVSLLVDEIRVPPREPIGPADGWQGYLQTVANAVRDLAVEHPHLFPLIATRPPAAPWLRPPLRSLQLVDDFLDGLVTRGMSDEAAVRTYKTFTSFLLGHLLLEVADTSAQAVVGATELDETEPSRAEQEAALDQVPAVERLEPLLRRHDQEEEFERALEALLGHLETELS